MKIYLDDDTASGLLAKLLRKSGHDVLVPSDIGMVGQADAAHLTRAIRDDRTCITKDYDDYALLHALILQASGRHPGIVVIRQENDPTRDLTPKGIVVAVRKLESAGIPIASEYIVLNHWR